MIVSQAVGFLIPALNPLEVVSKQFFYDYGFYFIGISE